MTEQPEPVPDVVMEVVVIAIDWSKPNVIATFGNRAAAERYREAMDGVGLRCIVQTARKPR